MSLLPDAAGATGQFVFAASAGQRRLWFLSQLEPDAPVCNMPYRLRLAGRLRQDLLGAALQALVDRHETLRTTFAIQDGAPVQVISESAWLALPVVDLGDHLDAGAEAERLADAEARRPFDLASGPLLRATLVRLAPDRHDLMLVVHHIVCDGRSFEVLLRELDEHYAALAGGRPSPLPELPIQYADYAHWEGEMLAGEDVARQLAHWRERLAGRPAALDLPTDHPRPAEPWLDGGRRSAALDPRLVAAVEALSRQAGCTPYMAFMAALQALLYRYTGQREFQVGVPVADRPRAEAAGLVGPFVNMLALPADLSGRPTFRQLLARVREAAVDAYANRDLPFERLVSELRPDRGSGRTPLFQVDLSMQQPPARPMSASGLEGRAIELFNGCSQFDLSINLAREGDGLRAIATYRSRLFEAATIDRLLGHYRTLLEAAAADPDRPVAALPLLTAGERRRVLVGWNATAADYPRNRCLHRLVESRTAAAPDALAVSGAGAVLTYRELNELANRLARLLRTLGVGTEACVAVCAERSPQMVAGQLAVLKAGGAYVPMDPDAPRRRLAAMLRDAGVSVVLTQRRLVSRLPRLPHVVCLDEPEAVAGLPAGDLDGGATPRGLAYVIYTSGSTGRPKGVQVEHRGLVNMATWAGRALGGIRPGDRSSQLVNPAFDSSVCEIWPHLVAGASIHLPDEETRMSPARLARWLAGERVSICFLPTVLARRVLDGQLAGETSLRSLFVAGERLDRVAGPLPFDLYNLYGPTEGTVTTTAAAVRAGDDRPSIGRPIDNVRTYVVDAELEPLPVGVPGELCFGGDGVARGYLGRPGLTAERFVPDPFGADPGGRLYRTGDLVRQRPDGELDFLGRIDHQVKVRGFRVEPGEIEAALLLHPEVTEAVVVAREGERGDRRLAAYVVPAGLEPAPLRAHLAEALPDYMVPAVIVPLSELPLTANRKIDRAALPEPVEPRPAGPRGGAPRSAIERAVAAAWQAVLGLDEVGLDDNFFDLGGHSLLLVESQERLQRELGRPLPMTAFFRYPTVATLAGHLAGPGGADAAHGAAEERALTRESAQRLERERRLASRRRPGERRE